MGKVANIIKSIIMRPMLCVAMMTSIGLFIETQAIWAQRGGQKMTPQRMVAIGDRCKANSKYAEALDWYSKAAQLGNSGALLRLFRCYLSGEGVAADEGKARDYLLQAANKGNAEAQAVLGNNYLYGSIGLPENRRAA